MFNLNKSCAVARVTQVVSFDAMNTLITTQENAINVYSRVAYKQGIVCNNDILTSSFHKAMSHFSEVYPCFGFGNISAEKWWHLVIKESFEKATNERIPENIVQTLSEELFELYKDPNVWKIVDEETIPLLSSLRKKGFSLVVTSNFDYRLRPLLQQMKLLELFDMALISGELGVEKPDPRIFKLILKHFNLHSASEILHIGDHPRKDYLGAKNIGCKALLFDPYLKENSIELSNKITSFKDLHIY